MVFLLTLFTAFVGLGVIILLAGAVVEIWQSVRSDDELKKIERKERRPDETN
jgi:hypothetical protein